MFVGFIKAMFRKQSQMKAVWERSYILRWKFVIHMEAVTGQLTARLSAQHSFSNVN